MSEDSEGSPESEPMVNLMDLVIILIITVFGMVFLSQAGTSKSFEKTYTINDLKFLVQSMETEGSGTKIIMNYEGLEGSAIKLLFDSEKISAEDAVSRDIIDQMKDWITKSTYFVYHVSDKDIFIGTFEISPLQEVIGDKGYDKVTPFFFIGIENNRLFIKSATEKNEDKNI